MVDPSQYKETLIDTIIGFLSDKEHGLGSVFKDFFYGQVETAGLSLLPCVIVQLNNTKIGSHTTGTEEIIKDITIKLVANSRAELGKTSNEVPGFKTLELYAEGVDPVTGEYDMRSVVGILRKNFSLGQKIVDQDIEIDYLTPELTDGVTTQAHIRFSTTGLKVVTNRI